MSNVSYKLLHKLALQDDGPSNSLRALLTSTLETTTPDGRPRHSEQAQQNLIKVIASHSYAKVIFPLCHFMAVAAQRNIPLYYWFTMKKETVYILPFFCTCYLNVVATQSFAVV